MFETLQVQISTKKTNANRRAFKLTMSEPRENVQRARLPLSRGSTSTNVPYSATAANNNRNARAVTTMIMPVNVRPLAGHRRMPRMSPRSQQQRLRSLRPKTDLETHSNSSSTMCRICFSGEEAGKLGKFCQCSGTIELCHHQCLSHWIQQSNMETCELCGYPYRMQQRSIGIWRWRCPPFQPMHQFFLLIYLVAWIAFLGSAGWLLFVTFGYDPLYRDSELAPLIYGLYGLISVAALGIIFFETIFVIRPFCSTLYRYNRETIVMPYDHRFNIEVGGVQQQQDVTTTYNFLINRSGSNFNLHPVPEPIVPPLPTAAQNNGTRVQFRNPEARYVLSRGEAEAELSETSALPPSWGGELSNSNEGWPAAFVTNPALCVTNAAASSATGYRRYGSDAIINFDAMGRAKFPPHHRLYCHMIPQHSTSIGQRDVKPGQQDAGSRTIPPSNNSQHAPPLNSAETMAKLDGLTATTASGESIPLSELSLHWSGSSWVPVAASCHCSNLTPTTSTGTTNPLNTASTTFIALPTLDGSSPSHVNIFFPYLSTTAAKVAVAKSLAEQATQKTNVVAAALSEGDATTMGAASETPFPPDEFGKESLDSVSTITSPIGVSRLHHSDTTVSNTTTPTALSDGGGRETR